ncbi:MAG: sulfurtransferase TusA family protein [Sphingomonadaceae bacterium]|nr:sulfurtransferase TusA family protein [Sphingomonadaceae bacterium]
MAIAESDLIDARGLRCPWPALRLARAMRDRPAARIVADDPIAPAELAALAKERGWAIASIETALGQGFLVSA